MSILFMFYKFRIKYYTLGVQDIAWSFVRITGSSNGYSFNADNMNLWCDSQVNVGGEAALDSATANLRGIKKLFIDWSCSYNSNANGVLMKLNGAGTSTGNFTGTWARRINSLAIPPISSDIIRIDISDWVTDSATSINVYRVWGEN